MAITLKRKIKRVPKNKLYRSGLEEKATCLLNQHKVKFEYEPKDKKLKYTKPSTNHTYLPDIIIDGVIYELKGYIPDLATRMKYVYVQEQNPQTKLIMVFQNPNLKINKGAKTTYREWFVKKGIEVMDYKDFEQLVKDKKIK